MYNANEPIDRASKLPISTLSLLLGSNKTNPAAVGLANGSSRALAFENVTLTTLTRTAVAELVKYILMDDLTFR